MKVISANCRYENDQKQRVLVEVQAVGVVYFETWSDGYKNYTTLETNYIGSNEVRDALETINMFDFDHVEIANFIHYSGCFYES